MEQTSCDKMEYMTDYFNQITFYMYEGPAPRIRSRNIPSDFFTCKFKDACREKRDELQMNNHGLCF